MFPFQQQFHIYHWKHGLASSSCPLLPLFCLFLATINMPVNKLRELPSWEEIQFDRKLFAHGPEKFTWGERQAEVVVGQQAQHAPRHSKAQRDAVLAVWEQIQIQLQQAQYTALCRISHSVVLKHLCIHPRWSYTRGAPLWFCHALAHFHFHSFNNSKVCHNICERWDFQQQKSSTFQKPPLYAATWLL